MSSNSPVEIDEGATGPEGSTEVDVSEVSEADAEESEVVDLTPDMIFEILKNERRRRVLNYLQDTEEPMKLGDLAEEIAARENDKTVEALSSRERKRVYVGLYQCHLPKMDDMDIVDFNRNRGLVELAENVELLEPYLDTGGDADQPWYLYYGGIAGVGALLFAASWAGLVGYGVTLGAVLAALVACSLAHAYVETGTDD